MKRTLLFVLALAVIPVGVDAQTDFQVREVAAMKRNAEAGEWYSAFQLALYYDEGFLPLAMLEDDVEALRWFKLALELGAAPLNALGGYAATYNNVKRILWLTGDMYVKQGGVPEDLVSAYMYFNLAEAFEWSDSDIELYGSPSRSKAAIEGRMTREQIAEAQRLSREWREAHPPGEGTLRR
tara:strand:- start:1412 stop:1957 length:546 start_codon:yes stop_codon:yes gene_type:complete